MIGRQGVIKSRIGIETQAIAFEKGDNSPKLLEQKVAKQLVVLIDEAQFLTRKQVSELTELVDHDNIPVLAYKGIRFSRRNF